jgi:membrane protein DedA with SNARE-associated domain
MENGNYLSLCTLDLYNMIVNLKISRPHLFAQRLPLLILMLILAAADLLHSQLSHALPTTETCLLTENQEPKTENRLFQDLEHALARVQPLLDHYGYLAVFLAVLVEGIGLVAPGQTLLIAAALTAAKGGLNLAWVLFWAFSAAALGNSLGYLLGRRGGRPLLHKIRVNERHLQRLEGYFARYGKGVVIIARFFDGLRQLNGILAGMLQMPWKEFTTCNILGAALWTGIWGLGAYFLEKEIESVHFTFRLVEPWIAALSLMTFLAVIVYLLRPGRKPKS